MAFLDKVPRISIRRDLRISLEENWEKVVVPAIKEAQALGDLITPETVFNDEGYIIGWYFRNAKLPPPHYIYTPPPFPEGWVEEEVKNDEAEKPNKNRAW